MKNTGTIPRPLVKIRVDQIHDNLWSCYLNSDRSLCGTGGSIPESIGDAVRSHQEEFGLEIEVRLAGSAL